MRKLTPFLGKNSAFVALTLLPCLPACSSREGHVYDSNRAVAELTPDLAPVVASNQQFSFALYRELVAENPDENLFFSPFSVNAALAMAAVGARGDTLSEMQGVLGIPEDSASYHQSFGALLVDLNGDHGRDYQLDIADGSFVDTGFTPAPDFQSILADDYRAPATAVPFSSDAEGARQTINAWVAARTEKTITELFPAGSIDGSVRLVLANAIYFRAPWATGFDAKDTAPAVFHTPTGDVTVPTMHNYQSSFSLLETADLTIAELDYEDREVSLVVLLPSAVDGLAALEAGLGADSVNQLIAALPAPETQPLAMPRFELRYAAELGPALTMLGMPSAFLDGRADFSGIDGGRDLFIGHVLHSVYVHVDESGTVASAATGVEFETRGGVRPRLTLDHPFVFLIRDKLTGAILFAGHLLDPS